MTENQPAGYGGVDDWRGHYNTVTGPEKIEARQRVYWLAVEREGGEAGGRVDLEIETLLALQQAGVAETATVVDIGCSFPNFLQLWKQQGHAGRLVGVEPNTKQFGGLPYWQPNPERGHEYIGNAALLQDKRGFEEIDLYEAWADALPLADGEADAATMMFMMYHVPKAVQRQALLEAKRILKPEGGVFALTTRGQQNKQVLRLIETAIGEELSRMLGSTVTPPPPVNAGFTSEDAKLVLPNIYRHVYLYEHTADIIVADWAAVGIVERALWSLLDKYVDANGRPPTELQFTAAVENVMRRRLAAARMGRLALSDELHESLFVASDRPLQLPDKFSEL